MAPIPGTVVALVLVMQCTAVVPRLGPVVAPRMGPVVVLRQGPLVALREGPVVVLRLGPEVARGWVFYWP